MRAMGVQEEMMIELLLFVQPATLEALSKCCNSWDRHRRLRILVDEFLGKREEEDWRRKIASFIGHHVWVHLPGEDGNTLIEGKMVGINEVNGQIEATVICRGERITFNPYKYRPHLDTIIEPTGRF